jgi:hypothetical protein
MANIPKGNVCVFVCLLCCPVLCNFMTVITYAVHNADDYHLNFHLCKNLECHIYTMKSFLSCIGYADCSVNTNSVCSLFGSKYVFSRC